MKKKNYEFSKKIIILLLAYAVIFTTWAFILMTIGVPVDSAIIISIVGGLFGEFGLYVARAHFGKKEEEHNNLMRDLYGKDNDDGFN